MAYENWKKHVGNTFDKISDLTFLKILQIIKTTRVEEMTKQFIKRRE